MRLLFVDCEERVLAGIENALIFAPDGWVADFAHSGAEALEMMDREHYDVVVTEMRMPGVSGLAVIKHARAHHPETVRVVLSAEIDPRLAEGAIPLVQEFVPKPCEPDHLFEIIDRVHTAARRLNDGIDGDPVAALDPLPAQPALHARLQESLARDEGGAMLARIIEEDLAIASAVMKTANSAFYGFKRPATTVNEAVIRLGSETVSGIVLNAEVAAWVDPKLAHHAEDLCSQAALVAEALRRVLGDVEHGALVGLLHDVGVLFLASRFPDDYTALVEQLGDEVAEEELERSTFGIGHAEVGAALLELWNADPVVVEATRHHHDPEAVTGDARRIVDAMMAVEAALAAGGEAEADDTVADAEAPADQSIRTIP